jgi:cytochrome P450
MEIAPVSFAPPIDHLHSRLRPAAPIPHTHRPTTIRFLLDLARNPIEAFGNFAYHEPYIYKRSWIRHFLLVNDPDGARHILLDNAANYIKGDQAVKRVRPVAGNGLLTAEGANWKFQRRTAAPIFQMRRVAEFAPAMTQATENMLSRWVCSRAGTRCPRAWKSTLPKK